MNNLFDEDPVRDAELAAQAWADWQAHIHGQLNDHREHYVAVATARLAGIDDTAAIKALDTYVASYGPEDLPLVLEMLGSVLWDGVRSVDREARTRLMKLRDADPITAIMEVQKR